jgi:hypothetical protein
VCLEWDLKVLKVRHVFLHVLNQWWLCYDSVSLSLLGGDASIGLAL